MSQDTVRQIAVAAGSAVAITGAAWGSGAFGGTKIADAADGSLASDATLSAPATPGLYLGWAAVASAANVAVAANGLSTGWAVTAALRTKLPSASALA